jgi:aminoglycoside 6'-N-acetyltransferase I
VVLGLFFSDVKYSLLIVDGPVYDLRAMRKANGSFVVRRSRKSDLMQWLEMRRQLWPRHSIASHRSEVRSSLGKADFIPFVAERVDGKLIGFLEASVRPYANGCRFKPVVFLEGIWVQADLQRSGVGGKLVQSLSRWCLENGFKEICSDVLIRNARGRRAHQAWGFRETEKVVYFRKPLRGRL